MMFRAMRELQQAAGSSQENRAERAGCSAVATSARADHEAQASPRSMRISGFGMEHDISKARAAGFSEHLTKPINFERLEEAIRNLLDREPVAKS